MLKRLGLLTLAAAAALLIGGCGDDDDGTTGEGEGEGETAFAGGNFSTVIGNIQDGCFDGAMGTAIGGDNGESTLPTPVAIPAMSVVEAGGATLTLDLNEPFTDVAGVAIEKAGGANIIKTSGTGFAQTGVDFNGEGCLTDMNVTATITTTEAGYTGTAKLTISKAEGDSCPVFTAGPPCDVDVTLTGTKQ